MNINKKSNDHLKLLEKSQWEVFIDTIAKIIQEPQSEQSILELKFLSCSEKISMLYSAVIQLEPSIDLKIISSFRKSKDAKTDMIHLGLIFMGKSSKISLLKVL